MSCMSDSSKIGATMLSGPIVENKLKNDALSGLCPLARGP
jgi:hypothetical protein